MASIPHGTTINAQRLAPERGTSSALGGVNKPPDFNHPDNILITTPFWFGNIGGEGSIPVDEGSKQ